MMHLQEGTSLQGGRYRIERVLGQGGFGITYLGVQTGLNRQVAIKEFFMKEYCERDNDTSHVSLGTSGSRETVERFRQKFVKEAQTISDLENRHIVRIYDVFEEHGTAYYVMEYLPGGDLRSRIPKGGMPETEALSYIRQIADALMFVHERNILHLDIKPGNVLFRSTGEAVLVDFGLSKHYDESSGEQTSSTPLGISEGYAPTEQYENSGVSSFSPATDIYSLGATFYCLLQGSRPPKASIVLNDGFPSLPAHVSSIVRTAIETAMQPRRNDRPQSVAAFLSLLDSSLENDDEGTVIDVVPSEPGRPVPLVIEEGGLGWWFRMGKLYGKLRKMFFPIVKKVLILIMLIAAIWGGCEWFYWEYYYPNYILPSEEENEGKEQRLIFPVDNDTSITGTISGHEYVDLGLSVKWATMNVGAGSPGDYGDYFAWGEVHPKSEYWKDNSKTYDKSMSEISGNSAYDAACYHWGSSWRLPTEKELEELRDECRWSWTQQDGHKGYKVVGPNGNSIFLPAAGFRNGASTRNARTHGYYWFGSPYEGNTHYAFYLSFSDDYRYVSWGNRSNGQSVRPVSD